MTKYFYPLHIVIIYYSLVFLKRLQEEAALKPKGEI